MNILRLSEAYDIQRFGGKAVQLGDALRSGLPVPEGYALSKFFVKFVVEDKDEVKEQLRDIVDDIGFPMAVRSSAMNEDGHSNSFAGIYKSFMNVCSIEDLESAIYLIWKSAQSNNVIAYTKRFGGSMAHEIGVIIQQMIYPDIAGVLFTSNPMTGEDERVIEASWGLGESCVSGLVIPDLYRVLRGGEIIESIAGYKDTAIYPKVGGGTESVLVKDELIHKSCIHHQHIAMLDNLAAQCEQHFGINKDIEWAIADSRLFLLQCRPITNLEVKK